MTKQEIGRIKVGPNVKQAALIIQDPINIASAGRAQGSIDANALRLSARKYAVRVGKTEYRAVALIENRADDELRARIIVSHQRQLIAGEGAYLVPDRIYVENDVNVIEAHWSERRITEAEANKHDRDGVKPSVPSYSMFYMTVVDGQTKVEEGKFHKGAIKRAKDHMKQGISPWAVIPSDVFAYYMLAGYNIGIPTSNVAETRAIMAGQSEKREKSLQRVMQLA